MQHFSKEQREHEVTGSVAAFSDALQQFYGSSQVVAVKRNQSAFGTIRQLAGNPFSACTVTTRAIRNSRPDHALKPCWDGTLFAVVQQRGTTLVRQRHEEALLRPNDIVIVEPESACEILHGHEGSLLSLHIDRSFGLSNDDVVAIAGRHISGHRLIGRTLGAFLRSLSLHQEPLDQIERSMINETLGSLLKATLASEERACDGILIGSLGAFVKSRLEDPELSAAALASHLGISLRSLYRNFAKQGTTPTNWLWNVRLETARRRIEARQYSQCSITEIAYSVGYSDSAHFSRSFRKRFGGAPRDLRRDFSKRM